MNKDKTAAAGVAPIELEIDGIGWVSYPPDWLLEEMAERRKKVVPLPIKQDRT
jgi:hypothetical protein